MNDKIILFGGSFGLNTNVFETNIINLGIVIVFLIYFGGDLLNTILKTRQNTIQTSLQFADDQLNKTQEKLLILQRLRLVQKLSLQLIEAPKLRVSLTDKKATSFINLENEIIRLQTLQLTTVNFEKTKVINSFSDQVKNRAINLSRMKLDLETNLRSQNNEMELQKFQLAKLEGIAQTCFPDLESYKAKILALNSTKPKEIFGNKPISD